MDGALAALAYENEAFSSQESNWAAVLKDENAAGEPLYRRSWCHGAPGIGLPASARSISSTVARGRSGLSELVVRRVARREGSRDDALARELGAMGLL